MATITGIVTNAGLSAVQVAMTNDGWYIKPSYFSVSADNTGGLDATRTTPNTEWFTSSGFAGRTVDSQNSITFIVS